MKTRLGLAWDALVERHPELRTIHRDSRLYQLLAGLEMLRPEDVEALLADLREVGGGEGEEILLGFVERWVTRAHLRRATDLLRLRNKQHELSATRRFKPEATALIRHLEQEVRDLREKTR